MDNITIFKRGEDAWDVCDDQGRIAPIRAKLTTDTFQPTGEWFIRAEGRGRDMAFATDQMFPSFQAAFAHICAIMLA